MTEIKYNNATIRIHGSCEPERLKAATIEFLKKVERSRKKNGKNHDPETVHKAC